MGGLLPIATENNNGLMSKRYAVRNLIRSLAVGSYSMFKVDSFGRYSTLELLANSDDGRMLLCQVVCSEYIGSPIKPALIKNRDFSGYIKFYVKEGQGNIFYFQVYSGSNMASLFIRSATGDYDVTNVVPSTESSENLVEISMQ